jgi:hypothetical protein
VVGLRTKPAASDPADQQVLAKSQVAKPGPQLMDVCLTSNQAAERGTQERLCCCYDASKLYAGGSVAEPLVNTESSQLSCALTVDLQGFTCLEHTP